MNIGKWVGFVILFILIDTFVAIGLHMQWVKKKSMTKSKLPEGSFPYNAPEKQRLVWYIVWTVMIYLNIGVYTLICWILAVWSGDPNAGELYVGSFGVAALGYTLLFLIIYGISKVIVVSKIKKNKKLN